MKLAYDVIREIEEKIFDVDKDEGHYPQRSTLFVSMGDEAYYGLVSGLTSPIFPLDRSKKPSVLGCDVLRPEQIIVVEPNGTVQTLSEVLEHRDRLAAQHLTHLEHGAPVQKNE